LSSSFGDFSFEMNEVLSLKHLPNTYFVFYRFLFLIFCFFHLFLKKLKAFSQLTFFRTRVCLSLCLSFLNFSIVVIYFHHKLLTLKIKLTFILFWIQKKILWTINKKNCINNDSKKLFEFLKNLHLFLTIHRNSNAIYFVEQCK
jgi:hypothetical protein